MESYFSFQRVAEKVRATAPLPNQSKTQPSDLINWGVSKTLHLMCKSYHSYLTFQDWIVMFEIPLEKGLPARMSPGLTLCSASLVRDTMLWLTAG